MDIFLAVYETKGVLRGIEVLTLKFGCAHAGKLSQAAGYVFHAQIDPTLLREAAPAPGLAGETHVLHNQSRSLFKRWHRWRKHNDSPREGRGKTLPAFAGFPLPASASKPPRRWGIVALYRAEAGVAKCIPYETTGSTEMGG